MYIVSSNLQPRLPMVRSVNINSVLSFQDTARRIAKVSMEAKIEVDEDTYVDSFKPHLMDVIHAWCDGAPFLEICKMTDVFEGKTSQFLSCRIFMYICS